MDHVPEGSDNALYAIRPKFPEYDFWCLWNEGSLSDTGKLVVGLLAASVLCFLVWFFRQLKLFGGKRTSNVHGSTRRGKDRRWETDRKKNRRYLDTDRKGSLDGDPKTEFVENGEEALTAEQEGFIARELAHIRKALVDLCRQHVTKTYCELQYTFKFDKKATEIQNEADIPLHEAAQTSFEFPAPITIPAKKHLRRPPSRASSRPVASVSGMPSIDAISSQSVTVAPSTPTFSVKQKLTFDVSGKTAGEKRLAKDVENSITPATRKTAL